MKQSPINARFVALLAALPSLLPDQALADKTSVMNDFFALNAITPYHLQEGGSPEVWTQTRANLKDARELGATFVRLDMWWKSIERERGQFDWEFTDRLMQEISDAGLHPYPILCYNAAWSPDSSPVTAENQKEFANYAAEALKRYHDIVPFWEVWNEPNIKPFWTPEPNAEHYTSLLRETSEQMRAIHPDVKLIGMCTAGADYNFIERVYQLGGAAYTDGISYHHYQADQDPGILREQIRRIRRLMHLYGDGDEPLIMSESGLSTGASSVIEQVSKMDQANGLVKKHLTSIVYGVDQFFYFKLLDDHPASDPDGYWGFLHWDRERKPSYFTYRVMTETLQDTRYIGPLYGYGETLQAVVFEDRESRDVIVAAWLPEPGSDSHLAEFPIEGEFELMDAFGQRVRSSAAVSPVRIEAAPKYISMSREAGAALKQQATLQSQMQPVYIGLGEKVTLSLDSVGGSETLMKAMSESLGSAMTGTPLKLEESLWLGNELTITISLPANSPAFETMDLSFKAAGFSFLLPIIREDPFLITGTAKTDDSSTFIYTSSIRSRRNFGETERITFQSSSGQIPVTIEEELGTELSLMQPSKHQLILSPVPGLNTIESSAQTTSGAFGKFTYKTYGAAWLEDSAIEIDGSLSDWPNDFFINLSGEVHQLVPSKDDGIVQATDLSGRVAMTATPTHLMIAADVTDDSPMINDFETTEIWRGDSVQLYIGFGGPTTELTYRPGQEFQIGVKASANPAAWNWRSIGNEDSGGAAIEGAEIVCQPQDGGYTLEASIPLTEFGQHGEISAHTLIGFDFQLNDRDAGSNSADFDSAFMWQGGPVNWRDPSQWGAAYFLPAE